MHVEALLWSNQQAQGGVIPGAVLRLITDEPDPELAAKELVESGAWQSLGDGWKIGDSLDEQPTPEEIERQRLKQRDRQTRSRKHKAGDHTTCDPRWCRQAPVTRDRTRDGGVSHDTPSRPDPTRSVPPRSAPTRPSPSRTDGEEGNHYDGSDAREAGAPADVRNRGRLRNLDRACDCEHPRPTRDGDCARCGGAIDDVRTRPTA